MEGQVLDPIAQNLKWAMQIYSDHFRNELCQQEPTDPRTQQIQEQSFVRLIAFWTCMGASDSASNIKNWGSFLADLDRKIDSMGAVQWERGGDHESVSIALSYLRVARSSLCLRLEPEIEKVAIHAATLSEESQSLFQQAITQRERARKSKTVADALHFNTLAAISLLRAGEAGHLKAAEELEPVRSDLKNLISHSGDFFLGKVLGDKNLSHPLFSELYTLYVEQIKDLPGDCIERSATLIVKGFEYFAKEPDSQLQFLRGMATFLRSDEVKKYLGSDDREGQIGPFEILKGYCDHVFQIFALRFPSVSCQLSESFHDDSRISFYKAGFEGCFPLDKRPLEMEVALILAKVRERLIDMFVNVRLNTTIFRPDEESVEQKVQGAAFLKHKLSDRWGLLIEPAQELNTAGMAPRYRKIGGQWDRGCSHITKTLDQYYQRKFQYSIADKVVELFVEQAKQKDTLALLLFEKLKSRVFDRLRNYYVPEPLELGLAGAKALSFSFEQLNARVKDETGKYYASVQFPELSFQGARALLFSFGYLEPEGSK